MRIIMNTRTRIAAASALVTVLTIAGSVHAQFAAPTCTPPNCNPAVIQNVAISAAAQVASINVTGSQKLGGTFQTGALAPVMTLAADNLMYGNVGGTSTNGSLLLLQFGSADRLRVTLTGQMQLPLGSAGAPSYSFIGDTNTGLYSSVGDSMSFATNGVVRMTINNNGTTIDSGVLTVPAGSAAAPSITFAGDTNTGIYQGTADTINFTTNGVARQTIDSTGAVTIPGDLTVLGTFTSSGVGGDGSSITNINASNITTGTLADGRLSSNVALYNANGTFTGNNSFTGMTSYGSPNLVVGAGQNMLYSVADVTSAGNLMLLQTESAGVYTDRFRVAATGAVTAASFSGVGTGLTALNASNLTSGTVPSDRISGTYSNPLTFSGANSYTNQSIFGGASLVVAAGQNLLYGNMDTTSAGNLLLLQNESVDRFRVDAAGNLTLSGTITATGSLTSGGVSVCLQNGANCPATLGGAGTPNYMTKFTGSGSTVGDSQIQDDGSTVGIGIAPQSAKLYVNGSIASTSVSTYQVAAGAAGVTGQVVGVGSYGVVGVGGSYGVYGQSGGYGVYGYNTSGGGSYAGVYGYHAGTGPGVQGNSAFGWGGSFSSLYVTPGTSYFASLVTLNGGATLGASAPFTLGTSAGDIAGANGRMSYNTATNKFRCFENGAWKDCVAAAGLTGSGTLNYVPKFTPNGTTLGNSQIFDDGTNIGISVSPSYKLDVNGTARFSGVVGAGGQPPTAGTGLLVGTMALSTGVSGVGVNYGVKGTANDYGVYGTGIYGTYGTGSAYGAYGFASGGGGYGGYFATASAGSEGVHARATAPATTAVYAEGNLIVTGTTAATGNITIAGVSVCRQNGVNCPPATEADTLATVTGRGATTTTSITIGPTGGTAITANGAGAGGYFTANSNGGIGVQVGMTALGSYGVYATNSGSGGYGAYANASGSGGIGLYGVGAAYALYGQGNSYVSGNSTVAGPMAVNGAALNASYGISTQGSTYGISAASTAGGYGVYGNGQVGVGGIGGQYGIYGSGTLYGVYGYSSGSYGVFGNCTGANCNGVQGVANGSGGTGVVASQGSGSYALQAVGTSNFTGDIIANNNVYGAGSGWIGCGQNGGYCWCPNGSFVGVVYHESNTNLSQALQVYCYKP